MSKPHVLFIRLSALGDVLLTLPALTYAKNHAPTTRRTLLTRSPLAEVLAVLDPSLELLRFPEDVSSRSALQRWLVREQVTTVLDLHGSLRTRAWLWGTAFGASPPVLRVERADLWRRRQLKRWPWNWLPAPKGQLLPYWQRAVELTQRALAGSTTASFTLEAETLEFSAAISTMLTRDPDGPARIALLPGAAHPTKAWPVRHWQALGQALSAQGLELLWLGGPTEQALLSACRLATPTALERCAGGADLIPLLARCSLAVGHDSGLTHLAEALGVPVLMLRGPTVSAFGFSPRLPTSQVLEQPLSCRPCSLHGGASCPLFHHACLESLAPARVCEQVLSHPRVRSMSA